MVERRVDEDAAGGAVAGGAIASVVYEATTSDPGGPGTAPPLDPDDWDSIRAQFPLQDGMTNLSTFYFASHSAKVRAAIERHRSGLDADPLGYVEENQSDQDGRVTEAAATYLETDESQIALTDSTTMGLGLLYSGLRLEPGDEVLLRGHHGQAVRHPARV